MQVRIMRILRMKYGIPLSEIARICGVSRQRISEIELETNLSFKPETTEKITRAFAEIVEKQHEKYQTLYQDFEGHREDLMDIVEDYRYEL